MAKTKPVEKMEGLVETPSKENEQPKKKAPAKKKNKAAKKDEHPEWAADRDRIPDSVRKEKLRRALISRWGERKGVERYEAGEKL